MVDASPLIILARAGRLELLQVLGAPIAVPPAVVDEVNAYSDEAARALSGTDWLTQVNAPLVPSVIAAWDLGAGETATLSWAATHPGSVAILDDYAARTCATVVRVEVVGTLGLALRAKQIGRVETAASLIHELRNAGLYLSESLIRQALALVGE